MISLRGAIERHREKLLHSVLDCCRFVVGAVAENGARVCPPVTDTFQQNLVALCDRLASATMPGEVARTEEEIGREIEGWSTRASEYYRRKAGEIRDVMMAMNEAAKSVADRDDRYRAQFREVSASFSRSATSKISPASSRSCRPAQPNWEVASIAWWKTAGRAWPA